MAGEATSTALEAGGLQGVVLVPVEAERDRLAVAHGPYHRDVPVDLDPASLAAAMGVQECHDLIAAWMKRLGVPSKLLPDLAHLAVEAPDPIMAVIGGRVEYPFRHVEVEIRVAQFGESV